MNTHKHTNLLINETSPYLLQHAHNPVDWRPWNEEALDTAMLNVRSSLMGYWQFAYAVPVLGDHTMMGSGGTRP